MQRPSPKECSILVVEDQRLIQLLVEQRRTGDEYRTVEKTVLGFKSLLSRSEFNAATRAKAEAALAMSCAELIRLGRRRLELDASVSLAVAGR